MPAPTAPRTTAGTVPTLCRPAAAAARRADEVGEGTRHARAPEPFDHCGCLAVERRRVPVDALGDDVGDHLLVVVQVPAFCGPQARAEVSHLRVHGVRRVCLADLGGGNSAHPVVPRCALDVRVGVRDRALGDGEILGELEHDRACCLPAAHALGRHPCGLE
eukprot:7389019-Prymnesium_polylepis.1